MIHFSKKDSGLKEKQKDKIAYIFERFGKTIIIIK